MANYIFNPADHPSSTRLDDIGWTQRFTTEAAGPWKIREPEAGLKVISYETTGLYGARRAISWDLIDSDVNRSDCEMLTVARAVGTTTASIRMLVRGAGEPGTETCLIPGATIDPNLAYSQRGFNSGSAVTIGSGTAVSGSFYGVWFACRARVNGNTHSVKVWLPADATNPTADEPATWTNTATSSTVSAAGWVGLGRFEYAKYEIRALAYATGGDTATLSAPSDTPVAFSGSVSNQTGTEGTAFSLDVSSYFSGTETPFAYSVQSGTLPAGLSLNTSTGVISGTPTTAVVSSGIVIRATDATPDTADTNAFSVTIDTEAPPPDEELPTLAGSVTFTSITQTGYTAQWPAGLDNVAVTGYEYQIGSTAGAWTDAGNSLSAAITGRTAGITETVYVRAYDAAGLRSTPAISGGVTLLAATASVTSEEFKNNPGTLLASATIPKVWLIPFGTPDYTNLITNGAGELVISEAGLSGDYLIVSANADGTEVGVSKATAS